MNWGFVVELMLIDAVDQCINYKAKDWKEQLAKACGDGVDLYFDNVAGETLDEMLPLVKDHGVIIACGGISGYNDDNPTVLKSKWVLPVVLRLY